MEITRRVKRSRRVRAAGRSGPQSRMFAGRWRARGAGRAREQISPLSETTSWNSRYSRARRSGPVLPGEMAGRARGEEEDGGGGSECSVKGRADERRGIEATKKRRRRGTAKKTK